ncbi:MAG: hypothetical protein CL779_00255 [Chloroflexi bacterium]|nr:hypothetical protein [Chloroflexota bacterium]|tara:strand:- start:509 stop:1183 length:675 start_codon:yes stop_codon:yes gene_type:complete
MTQKNVQSISLIKKNSALLINFNRENKLNAIDLHMRDVIWEGLRLVQTDIQINALIFTSEVPGCFSSGADINDFGTAPSIQESKNARLERDIWGVLNNLDVPIFSFVDGIAYGAGFEIVLASDYIYATSQSRFALPEIKLGYIPAAGGSQLIIRRLPSSDAKRIVYTGEPISTDRLYELGLINRIIERKAFDTEIDILCKQLLNYDTKEIRTLKSKFVHLINTN